MGCARLGAAPREAVEVADLGRQDDRRHQRDAAPRLEGGDNRRQRPALGDKTIICCSRRSRRASTCSTAWISSYPGNRRCPYVKLRQNHR
jgi:hypothetical protein